MYDHSKHGFPQRKTIALTGCHAAGQGILCYDGSIKPVEEIVVGDQLMGPDSAPREVLTLCRGVGPMYRVSPVKGESFVVNEEHLLTLVHTQTNALIDVSVAQYLSWSPNQKHLHKLFRAQVDFSVSSPLPLSPYFLGIYLGDGTSRGSGAIQISKPDQEILAEVEYEASRNRQGVTIYTAPGRCPSYTLTNHWRPGAPIKSAIKMLGLFGLTSAQRFIPYAYKTASREDRLELLAGLLDTDGHCKKAGKAGYDWVSASEQLAHDILYVARSLGLAAYSRRCIKTCQNNYRGIFWRVSISGNCSIVPCRLARKQAAVRQQIKNVLRTGFSIQPIGQDRFYGFRLTDDGRYLLGDFTVTHNSGKTVIFGEITEQRRSIGRTVILAHREELIDQAIDKLHRFKPTAGCLIAELKSKLANAARGAIT